MSILKLKKDVLDYMESVIADMNDFYSNRLYLKQDENIDKRTDLNDENFWT